MDGRLTLEDIAKTIGVTSRTLRNQWKNDGNLMEIFKGNSFRDGKRIFYHADTLEKVKAYYKGNRKNILPVNKSAQTKYAVTSSDSKPNKETKKLKKIIQNLETEIQMLTFQLSLKMEQEKELRKDKEYLQGLTIKQSDQITELHKSLLESQSNIQRAQTLQYLDKDTPNT